MLVTTKPKTGKKRNAKATAPATIAPAETVKPVTTEETQQAEEMKPETNVSSITCPISIPVKDGASSKFIEVITFEKLGKSIADLLKRYESTFIIRMFGKDIEVKKNSDFQSRTFNFWLKIVAVIFANMLPDEKTKDVVKVAFLKAMPFKFEYLCLAAVKRAVELRKKDVSVIRQLIRIDTDKLNGSTIVSIIKNTEKLEVAKEQLKTVLFEEEKIYLLHNTATAPAQIEE